MIGITLMALHCDNLAKVLVCVFIQKVLVPLHNFWGLNLDIRTYPLTRGLYWQVRVFP